MGKKKPRPDGPTKTVAYIRVSTDKQADEGVSLDTQRAKVAAYAELYGLELVDTLVDAGKSAKSLDRPALQKALAMLRTGEAHALLVVKLDRLTRSVRDLGDLVAGYFAKPDGPALLSVSEQVDTRTAGGRLVLNVLGAVSQWEREATSERVSSCMRYMVERGEYIGGPAPFGYQLAEDGKLQPNDAEQLIIEEVQALGGRGMSLRQIATALAGMGYKTRSGGAFAPQQIKRMLKAA